MIVFYYVDIYLLLYLVYILICRRGCLGIMIIGDGFILDRVRGLVSRCYGCIVAMIEEIIT